MHLLRRWAREQQRNASMEAASWAWRIWPPPDLLEKVKRQRWAPMGERVEAAPRLGETRSAAGWGRRLVWDGREKEPGEEEWRRQEVAARGGRGERWWRRERQ